MLLKTVQLINSYFMRSSSKNILKKILTYLSVIVIKKKYFKSLIQTSIPKRSNLGKVQSFLMRLSNSETNKSFFNLNETEMIPPAMQTFQNK